MSRSWKRSSRLAAAMSLLALIIGCTAQSTDEIQTTTPTPSPSTTTTPTAQTPTTTSTVTPATTTETPVSTTKVVDETVVTEPFVVECLQGTPGPAKWSDGSMRYSQWCFDTMGGAQYLESERQANAFTCNGIVCQNPYTGGTYPDPSRVTSQPGTIKPATPEEAALNKQLAEQSGCKTSGCTQT